MNGRMVGTVALHEFLASVMRGSFVLITLGMPVLSVAYLGLVVGLGALAASDDQARERVQRPVGIVDHTAALMVDDPELWFESEAAARAALEAGEISAFAVVPPDFVEKGRYAYYLRQYKLLRDPSSPTTARIRRGLLRAEGVSEALWRRVRRSPSVTFHERTGPGAFAEVDELEKVFSLAVPGFATFGLILALSMNASLLLGSVVEDKENKMMDVLLSSIRADELLFGKVLGIVGAGLLQLGVWAVLFSAVVVGLSLTMPEVASLSSLPLARLGLASVFGVLSLLFYGVMLVGLGSFGSSFRDSQQVAVVVILMPMIPFIALPLFLSNAHGIVPRVMSFLPPTAAPAMMLRLALAPVAWWELGAALLVLIVSTWVAAKASARLFRVGTLLYGTRPSVGRIWKALVS